MITNGIAAVFTVGYLGTTFWICRGFRFSVKTLCLGAISIAMTLVLAYISIFRCPPGLPSRRVPGFLLCCWR